MVDFKVVMGIAPGKLPKIEYEPQVKTLAITLDLDKQIQDLLNGKVIHVDETPIKTSERPASDGKNEKLEKSSKTTFSAYIRTYSNKNTTLILWLRSALRCLSLLDSNHDPFQKLKNIDDLHLTNNGWCVII